MPGLLGRQFVRIPAVILATTGLHLVSAFPLPPAANAQSPDSSVSSNHGGVALGLLVGNAMIFFAPPTLFLLPPDTTRRDTTTFAFRRPSIAMYVAGGYTERLRSGPRPRGWTTAGNVQIYYQNLFGDLRLEQRDVGRDYELRSARVGYLFLRRPGSSAGLSVGLQREGSDPSRDAVAIGLPAVLFNSAVAWGRLEPLYVISRAGVEWHYRGEVMFPLKPRSSFVAGVILAFQPLPSRGPYYGNLGFVIGVRR
jgi:hypothetical protein